MLWKTYASKKRKSFRELAFRVWPFIYETCLALKKCLVLNKRKPFFSFWLIDWLIDREFNKVKTDQTEITTTSAQKIPNCQKNKNTEKSYREHIYKTLLELIRSYNKKCHHDVRKEKEKSCHFKSTQKLINIYYNMINEHISNIPRYNKIRKPTSLEKKKKEKVTPTIPILKQYNPSQIKPKQLL